jgi:hypothetical protein
MKLKIFYIPVMIVLITFLAFSQDRLSPGFSPNEPTALEKQNGNYNKSGPLFNSLQEQALKQAQESGNTAEAERLLNQMYSNVPKENLFKANFNGENPDIVQGVPPPFNPDWYNTDVTIYSGDIKYGNPYFRQIDMKMGEDGNMYIAYNRAPVTGTSGRIDVYRSSTGGATWTSVASFTYSSGAYIGTVSLLVELRDAGNMDSTRIFVFYTKSSNENNDNASLAFVSCRRNGGGFYSAEIATPPSGQEFSFVSAASDGAFYSSGTWIGAFCTQSNNALTQTNDFRYYRSLDWGTTWTGVTISTAYNDFYPSAEFRPASTSVDDSVWIAVERRISSTQYEIRVISTKWTPTASSNIYYVTSGGANIYFEKPALTVKQNRSCDSAMFTMTRDGVSYYYFTTNGGGAWSNLASLGGTGNGNNKLFTWCSSSPTGGNHFMGAWLSSDGDSLNIRRGVLDQMGTNIYKRNSHTASTSVSPTCMVYSPTTSANYSVIGYAGLGPTNIYCNQENLVTGINPISTNAVSYELGQNYPNPFNPVTNISFSIPKASDVRLSVFDMLGREVTVLVNEKVNAGVYSVEFNASMFSSGVYFYNLVSADYTAVKKMVLVK